MRCGAAIPISFLGGLTIEKKNSIITQLRREQASLEKELEQTQHEGQRLKNRLEYLDKGERRKRAHRLITRGAAIESILPEVKGMDEVSFYALMEEVLTHPDVANHIRLAVSDKKAGDS